MNFMSDPATATITGDAARSADQALGTERNPHKEAWIALVQAHAALTGRVQEALAGADFPPLPWFEVLSALADAPEERLKMGDLAEALVITRGGLTKLVDRLIKAGLLERTFCETDRRVSYATLLPAGREMLEEMRPVVVTELRASFSSRLTVEEADAMRRSLERVRSAACSLGE
jgi:DNA-binding MarR family transcriptional regulator